MKAGWRSNWKGDVTGGVTAAVLTVPVSMGYGILALYPLGDQYVSYAILAGLYSAALVPIAAVLLGADTPAVYAPRSVVTFLLGSIVLHSLVRSAGLDLTDVHRTLTFVLFVVLAGGLFQALFGALRLGTLVQYIPSPVMAGFQDAAAVLILRSQLDTLLGFRRHVPPLEIVRHLDLVEPLTFLVGLATVLAMWQGPRISARIPPTILGLGCGTATYYAITALGHGRGLGPVIGPLPLAVPSPSYVLDFASLATDPAAWALLPSLVTGALSLAIVASLDALLCAKAVEGVTGQRVRGNRELLRLGLGNAIVACFGAISSGINLGSSFANYKSGGRTQASVLVSAGLILLAVLAFSPVIAYIPRAVIAGLLTVVAFQLFDRWSLQILKQMLGREFAYWRSMTVDLLVILLVATVAIVSNLVAAVAIGVGLTILSFLLKMSRSAVRRAYRGDAIHSRRTRDPRHMEVVLRRGGSILVLELEGPIFFGTAEDLASRVDAAVREGVSTVVLDLKRVNEIDSTGARILLQIHQRLARAGRHLLVSHADQSRRVSDFLQDMRVTAALTRQRMFHDTDRALEWAEDRLIAAELGEAAPRDDYTLEQLDVLSGLTEGQCDILRGVLARRTYEKGDVVFSEGADGRELYIIARGTASVRLRLAGDGRENRLATFSAGTVFGELALLDQGPRSATIVADEELVCYVLTETAFHSLTREHGAIAITLLTNLGRELSRRLRRANRTIYELES
jgi:SulP family sulfate permease